jgi:hypothetical protein
LHISVNTQHLITWALKYERDVSLAKGDWENKFMQSEGLTESLTYSLLAPPSLEVQHFSLAFIADNHH